MCPALRDLMKDEIAKIIAEERAEAIRDTRLVNIRKMMKNLNITAQQAMQALELSAEDQAKYSAMI